MSGSTTGGPATPVTDATGGTTNTSTAAATLPPVTYSLPHVTYRPARASSVLAVALSLLVVALLHRTDAVWLALSIEAAGLLAIAGGVALHEHGRWRPTVAHTAVGALAVATGVVLVVLALLLVVMWAARYSVLIQVLPGMLGAFLLTLGLHPVRGSGSRFLVKAGTALVFTTVLAAGLFRAPTLVLLVAGVVTIVAWDVAEHAISVGEHLGAAADTRAIEATHLVASLLVGALAVLVAVVVTGLGTAGHSLSTFVLLLVAVLLLTAALHA